MYFIITDSVCLPFWCSFIFYFFVHYRYRPRSQRIPQSHCLKSQTLNLSSHVQHFSTQSDAHDGTLFSTSVSDSIRQVPILMLYKARTGKALKSVIKKKDTGENKQLYTCIFGHSSFTFSANVCFCLLATYHHYAHWSDPNKPLTAAPH